MANTYKNIVITPNIGSNSDPKIVFSGANSTVNTDITLTISPSSNGEISFEGSIGQLFSITNDMDKTLFGVSDVSGISIFEVFANAMVSFLGANSYFDYNGNLRVANTVTALSFGSTSNTTYFGNSFNIAADGSIGIGAAPASSVALLLSGTAPATAASRAIQITEAITPTTTSNYITYSSYTTTQNNVSIGSIYHFFAATPGYGSNNTITNLFGYYADSSLNGATNNYGFFSALASANNTWNFYAHGTAPSYFNGNVGIGITTPNTKLHVVSGGNLNNAGSLDMKGAAILIGSAAAGIGIDGNQIENSGGPLYVNFNSNQHISLAMGGGNVGIGNHAPGDKLVVTGNITPGADNVHNLGSTTLRWANIYTGDLHLSNERSSGNDIDGSTGNWTIQEGESELYIINNKNGKKYKFKLEEVQ